MNGTGVPEGFTLPWNTTRSLAEVWADDFAAEEGKRRERRREIQRRHRAKNAEIRGQVAKAIKADDRRRVTAAYRPYSNLPKVTPAGKLAYAGYDGEEA